MQRVVSFAQLTIMLLTSILVGAFISQQKQLIAALHEISLAEASFIDSPSSDSWGAEPTVRAKTQQTRNTESRIQSCQYQQQTLSFRPAPNFIILGAQKAGTSALADFLETHPQMEGPALLGKHRYEAHFLDWMIPKKEIRDEQIKKEGLANEDELFCRYQLEYSSMWNATALSLDPSKVAYEKTPSYLFLAYVIPDILPRVCPWKPKLLAILRNPIDRAWSQFNMDKKLKTKFIGKNDTFEDILEREMSALRLFGLSVAPPLNDTVNYLDPRFDLPLLQQHEIDAAHKKVFRKVFLANYLQRGMYAVQLTRWKQAFGDDLMVINYDDLFGPSAQDHFDAVLRFVGVHGWAISKDFESHWSRNNYRRTISNSTFAYLHAFFRPHNELLSSLLGESWRGVWT